MTAADAPDPTPTDPTSVDVQPPAMDPDGLKDAHGRTGRMLKNAGLPFEADEFDGDGEDQATAADDDSSSSSSSEEE